MAKICPSITATNPHEFREQVERVAAFAERIHLDFMDGELAPSKSPSIEQAWWPAGVTADMHLMFKRPADHLEAIIKMKPHLVIIHSEADGNFAEFAETLHKHHIRVGVALVHQTKAEILHTGLAHIDHVLIFSGHLGYFGGHADLELLHKVKTLRSLKPNVEIGWDGGVNSENIKALVERGIDILNVGGFIQKAHNPAKVYDTLIALAEK